MSKIKMLGTLSLSLILLSACSGGSDSKQFLKNVSVNISSQNQDSYVNLVSQFDLGPNVTLAGLDVTVIDPKNQTPRGNVTFAQLPGGLGQITVSVNVSLISDADPTLGQTMPNGRPIPLALGAQAGDVLGVPLMEHSRVYVGGDTNKTAFIGTALGIQGFDQVMNQLQTPANIFFMYNIDPKVLGVGGIYGSNVAYENGIAVFGKYIANPSLLDSKNQAKINAKADYEIEKLNSATVRKLMRFFYGKKKHHLNFY